MIANLKLEEHSKFWRRANRLPLCGVIAGGWSVQTEMKGAVNLRGNGNLDPALLRPDDFLEDYIRLLAFYEDLGDDLVHTALPYATVPWVEALAGCPVRRGGSHLWADNVPGILEQPDTVRFDQSNPWTRKYDEFLEVYARKLSPRFAVAQSVVRGPIDVLSALLGPEEMVMAMCDRPVEMRRLLEHIVQLVKAFLLHQRRKIPDCQGGSVVGLYEIWAPGWALRLQEDSVALISPDIYRNFIAPLDKQLFALTPYNLLHTHSTSMHILPQFLEQPGLGAVEISKDEGVSDVKMLWPAFKSVQAADHPLVIRGRLDNVETEMLLRELDPRGLSIQVVVDTEAEACQMLEILRDSIKMTQSTALTY